MARKGRQPGSPYRKLKERPRRTREHIIADLSILYFQRLAVLCGYAAEAPVHDYGYDLVLFTYTKSGEIENGSVLLQFKATDNLEKYLLENGQTISYPIERRHVQLWRDEPMPVILIIYDAQREQAYWLYTQPFFESKSFLMDENQATVSLHIPMANVVDALAVQGFRDFKITVLRHIKELRLHNEASNL